MPGPEEEEEEEEEQPEPPTPEPDWPIPGWRSGDIMVVVNDGSWTPSICENGFSAKVDGIVRFTGLIYFVDAHYHVYEVVDWSYLDPPVTVTARSGDCALVGFEYPCFQQFNVGRWNDVSIAYQVTGSLYFFGYSTNLCYRTHSFVE